MGTLGHSRASLCKSQTHHLRALQHAAAPTPPRLQNTNGTPSLVTDTFFPHHPRNYTGRISAFVAGTPNGFQENLVFKISTAQHQFSSYFRIDDRFWRDSTEFALCGVIMNVQLYYNKTKISFRQLLSKRLQGSWLIRNIQTVFFLL
ncbi:hypothetical protein AVEN_97315-1 [Araneus ventricosus]|uniref:Uncharacterized protein n=1 Tax=Araneus ventricosus TaxID=182803 RepID=A0A4Y2HPM7_ARAVE|nr:hypothetical protein AVEN_97315-1 [Araneus ventricosus]